MGLLDSLFGKKDKKQKRADFSNVSSGSSSTAPAARKPEIDTPVTPTSATPAAPAATEYEIKSGDSLSAIAKRFYGDATQWRKIYDANRDVMGDDPDKIYPGQKITIPNAAGEPDKPDFGNVSNV
jgi:nucleoid-associated protein YgaU